MLRLLLMLVLLAAPVQVFAKTSSNEQSKSESAQSDASKSDQSDQDEEEDEGQDDQLNTTDQEDFLEDLEDGEL
jgi:hypothetical protein